MIEPEFAKIKRWQKFHGLEFTFFNVYLSYISLFLVRFCLWMNLENSCKVILFYPRLEQTTSSALSRLHHLHVFSQKLRYKWENIWRKFVHINHLNNVSSNLFQNMLSGLADNIISRADNIICTCFSQKLKSGRENIWRKFVHIKFLYYNLIGPKIKKWEQNLKKRVLNNPLGILWN
jgi:hypothetical protein